MESRSRIVPCLTLSLVLASVLIAVPSGKAQEPPPAAGDEPPREIGLVEKTTGRLAQIDVTATGPPQAIGSLTADDFELVVGGKFIESFVVDRICDLPGADQRAGGDAGASDAAGAGAADTPSDAATPATVPVTYLFYFDHHHLKPAGRQNALDIARRLIPELVRDGNRAMIVSAGIELKTFAPLTDDTGVLLDALQRIEDDHDQWDPYPYQEDIRVRDVLDRLSEDTTRAVSLARQYQREELYHTGRALRLFSLVLGRLADIPPPKAAIYFADTMRSNAGEHFLSFFSQRQQEFDLTNQGTTTAMRMDSFGAATAFDQVVEEAAANGVRLYTVQAEGLVGQSSLVRGSAGVSGVNSRGTQDAQDSLVGLAKETGGQAFLNGIPAQKIARRITEDLQCVYLLSFPPEGLALDSPLPVVVRVKRPKVHAQARGTMTIQSEESRVTSRLMAAFVSPENVTHDWAVRGVVIPTGYEDGAFTTLVQVAVPGSPLAQTEWDVGLSLVARGKVREDASRRIGVNQPGVPVVLEKEISFRPGPYEMILVARETRSDQIATSKLEGEWPDPDDQPASVGPVAILQPAGGAFLREDRIRTRGALGKDSVSPVHDDLPTVLVGLICRDKSVKKPLRVDRLLIGESSVGFPPLELDLGDDRCAQIRDRIPAGVMTPGGFTYQIRVLDDGGEELAVSRTDFPVTDARASAAGAAAGG